MSSAPEANRCCNWTGALIDALHAREFEVAVETNGTIAAPDGIDWLCVSPKAGAELVQRSGDELKLVYPQAGAPPESYAGLAFRHFFLQPMDGPLRQANTEQALRYCLVPSRVAPGPADAQVRGHPMKRDAAACIATAWASRDGASSGGAARVQSAE